MTAINSDVCRNFTFAEIKKHTAQMFKDNGVKIIGNYNPNLNGLRIECRDGTASVSYSKKVYFYRALGIISEQNSSDFIIEEKGRFNSNGIMVDCSRNAVPAVDTLKKLICQMAVMGLDTLMLYTEDTYEIKNEPYFGYMRGRYTEAELKEINKYAFEFGVEMVPCIQTLAHMSAALKWPAYYGVQDTGDILLVDEPQTYALIERMISMWRSVFNTNRIHIGMDEAYMLGRGAYYDRHGANSGFELMCRHLEKVADICRKYDFEPMIWSDMFFSYVNGGNYHGPNPVPEDLIKIIPKNVSLVYWDYYRDDPKEYERMIKNHLLISPDIVFAGGAWKFRGFVPSLRISMQRTAKAFNLCYENGVKDVFITAWGDNGAEAGLFSVLPVFQMQAELGFHSEVDDKYLAERLKTCTSADFEDFMKLDMPELPPEKNDGIINPHRYLLFQDILMGLYDYHVPKNIFEKCSEIHKSLNAVALKKEAYGYLFESASALYAVLELKAELGIKLKAAYEEKNNSFIEKTVNDVLPELILRIEALRSCLEKQWMTENKCFGFEVMDMRLGALLQRVKTARNRLRQYLHGDISRIEELEEQRLPFVASAENEPIRCDAWSRIVTACII